MNIGKVQVTRVNNNSAIVQILEVEDIPQKGDSVEFE